MEGLGLCKTVDMLVDKGLGLGFRLALTAGLGWELGLTFKLGLGLNAGLGLTLRVTFEGCKLGLLNLGLVVELSLGSLGPGRGPPSVL